MRSNLHRRLGWAIARLPTLLVWAGLIGLFVYGSTHGWKFSRSAEKEKDAEKKDADDESPEPDGAPFEPHYLAQPYDVPVYVAHDPAQCKAIRKPIRFKSPDAEAKAGITTAPAELDWVRVTVSAPGGVLQTPAAVASVATPVAGTVYAVEKQLGAAVRRGDVLALIDAPEVGRAKAALRAARAGVTSALAALNAAQERVVIVGRSNPTAELTRAATAELEQARVGAERARITLAAARQSLLTFKLPLPTEEDEALPDPEYAARLLLLGVPLADRFRVYSQAQQSGQPPTANLLPLRSSLDGVVMKPVPALLGQPVAAGQVVFEVGDPTRVDVFLSVRLEDLPAIHPGQGVTFRAEGAAPVDGVVSLIDPKGVDTMTRTQRVWVRVGNTDGVLRGGAFGTGEITVEPYAAAVVVPRRAVHWEGCCHVVFVRQVVDKDGVPEVQFQPRRVTLGIPDGDAVEITSGLEPGEPVAVVGSHVLKNEMLKERIGQAEE